MTTLLKTQYKPTWLPSSELESDFRRYPINIKIFNGESIEGSKGTVL